MADEQLPPDPGTSPVPEGHVRLWHYTPLGNVPSIREHGLQRQYARGDAGNGDLSDPSAGMWASTKRPDELLNSHDSAKAVVEFHAHPDEISGHAESPWRAMNKDRSYDPGRLREWGEGNHHVIMRGSVPPEHILAIHQPWHAAARYMRDDDPTLEEYQWAKDDYARGGNDHLEPYVRGLRALEGGSIGGKQAAAVSWYHGTPEELPPGTVLRPGDEIGKRHMGRGSDSAHLWVSSDPWRASSYGVHIYQVQPHDQPRAPHEGSDEHVTAGATMLREVPYHEAVRTSPAYQAGARAYAEANGLHYEAAADSNELLGHFEAADYSMQHTAPNPAAGHLPLHHYQGGSPDEPVRIYRSAPPGTESINAGDWISLSPEYAHLHGRHATDPGKDWPVYTAEVPQKHVHWDENDPQEHGYNGPVIRHPDVHDEETGEHHDWHQYDEAHPHGLEAWAGASAHLSPAEHEFVHDDCEAEDDRATTLLDAARAQGSLRGARWRDDLYPAREDAEAHAQAHLREAPEGHRTTAFTVHRDDQGTLQRIGIHHFEPSDDPHEHRRYQHIDDLPSWHYGHPEISRIGMRREAAVQHHGISGETAPEGDGIFARPSGPSPVYHHYRHMMEHPGESARVTEDGSREWVHPHLSAPDHGPYHVIHDAADPDVNEGTLHVVDRNGGFVSHPHGYKGGWGHKQAYQDWHRLTYRQEPEDPGGPDMVDMLRDHQRHAAEHPPQFPHSRVSPLDEEILKRPDARVAEPQGHSPSEEYHGSYEVVRHPETGRFHVVDNQGRLAGAGYNGAPTQLQAERSRDYVEKRQQGKERAKGIAESLWGGAHEALDPGGTDESRHSERNMETASDLMSRYEGGLGEVKFDDDRGGEPYYEREHLHGSGAPSGWYARHYGGPGAEMYHRATGDESHDLLRLPEHPEDVNSMTPRLHPSFGDDDLAAKMKAWHDDSEGGMREHQEENDPRIQRWKQRRTGSAHEVIAHFEQPKTAAAPVHMQQKLFHMQPDPTMHEPGSMRHNPADPLAGVQWRKDHEEAYEQPQESWDDPEKGNYDEDEGAYLHPEKGWHCRVCDEFHGDVESVRKHDTGHTNWDRVYPGLPAEMHRGLRVADDGTYNWHPHRLREDDGREGAARSIMSRLNDIGTHWTPDEDQARHYAGTGGGRHTEPDDMHVVVHARKPEREHIETDPDTLGDQNVIGFDGHDDAEIPLKEGAPVHVNGVSWKFHDEPDSAWRRHTFDAPAAHTAALENGHQRADMAQSMLNYDKDLSDGDRAYIQAAIDHIRRKAPPSEPIDAGDAETMARSMRANDRLRDAGWDVHDTMRYPRGVNMGLGEHHRVTLSPNTPSGWHVCTHPADYGSAAGHIHHDLDVADEDLPSALTKYYASPQIRGELAAQQGEVIAEGRHEAAVVVSHFMDGEDHDPVPEWGGGRLFHGTRSILHPGEMISADEAARHRAHPLDNSEGYVHATPKGDEAQYWAEHADPYTTHSRMTELGRGRTFSYDRGENQGHAYPPRVYEVEPTGHVEPDPNGEGSSYRSAHPMRVAREVRPLSCYAEEHENEAHWPGHPHYEYLLREQEEDDDDQDQHHEAALMPGPDQRSAEEASSAPSFTWKHQVYGPNGGYIDKEQEVSGPFYHGSRSKRLRPGSQVKKGMPTNPWGDEGERSQFVHFTTDHGVAAQYAREADGHVYEVEPTGEVRAGYDDSEWKSEHPLRVIRHVPEEELNMRTAAVAASTAAIDVVAHFGAPGHFDFYDGEGSEDGRPRTSALEEHLYGHGGDLGHHYRLGDAVGHAWDEAYNTDPPSQRASRYHQGLQGLHRQEHERMIGDAQESVRHGAPASRPDDVRAHLEGEHHQQWRDENEQREQHRADVAEHLENGQAHMHGQDVSFGEMTHHLVSQHGIPSDALPEHRLPDSGHGDPYQRELEEMHEQHHGDHSLPANGSYRHTPERQYVTMHWGPRTDFDAEHHLVEHHGFDINELRHDEPDLEDVHERDHAQNRSHLTHHLYTAMDPENNLPGDHGYQGPDADELREGDPEHHFEVHSRDEQGSEHHGIYHAEDEDHAREMHEDAHPYDEEAHHVGRAPVVPPRRQYTVPAGSPDWSGNSSWEPPMGSHQPPNEHGVDTGTAHSWTPARYVSPARSGPELWAHLREHHGVTQSADSTKEPGSAFMIGLHNKFHDGEMPDRGTPHQHDFPEGHDPVFGSAQGRALVAHFGGRGPAVPDLTVRDTVLAAQGVFGPVLEAIAAFGAWEPEDAAEAVRTVGELEEVFEAFREGLRHVTRMLEDLPLHPDVADAVHEVTRCAAAVEADFPRIARMLPPEAAWEEPGRPNR